MGKHWKYNFDDQLRSRDLGCSLLPSIKTYTGRMITRGKCFPNTTTSGHAPRIDQYILTSLNKQSFPAPYK